MNVELNECDDLISYGFGFLAKTDGMSPSGRLHESEFFSPSQHSIAAFVRSYGPCDLSPSPSLLSLSDSSSFSSLCSRAPSLR